MQHNRFQGQGLEFYIFIYLALQKVHKDICLNFLIAYLAFLQVLPRQLAVPWCDVSSRLGVVPVISHASFVLANWKVKDRNK